MPEYFYEENKQLEMILGKLQHALKKLDTRVSGYADEFKKSMRYLWENKSDMDSMEIFSNQRSISQIVNSGDFTAGRQKIIKKLIDAPYFARIDFLHAGEEEAEEFYIGRFAFSDDSGNMLIYDWRAPVSSMYYDFELGPAHYEAPMGLIEGELVLKRQFKIKNSRMEYALESAVSINDEVLQRELSHTSDQRMKNIVATIQREQNKIIRNENAEVLIIQGAAGSGKTSIALHRVAFLLYKYKERLSAQNIVIISPNKVFADYISNVLPELGEEPITEISFEDIAADYIKDDLEFEVYAEQIENLLEDCDEKRAGRIRFKASLEFLQMLDEYLEFVEKEYFEPCDYKYGDITVPKDLIQRTYNAHKNHPILRRMTAICDTIVERIRTENIIDKKVPGIKEVMKRIFEMFRFDNALDLYMDFYKYIQRPDMLAFKGNKKFENSDVFPYIYIKLFLEGAEGVDNTQHLVIDEMQDYTPVQYAVINKLYKCRKTILGDLGQSVNPYNTNSLQSFNELFKNSETIILNRSYRSTYEIIKFAQKIQSSNVDPIERHGDEPQILQFESSISELDAIKSYMTDFENSNFSTLGIICKTNRQAKVLYDELIDTCDVNLLDAGSLKFLGGITITSVHMSKGLEFDEVIVPFCSSETYRSEYDRSLLYIACTRAMHKLTLTYHGELSQSLPNNGM